MFVDSFVADAKLYFAFCCGAFGLMIWFRRALATEIAGWLMLNASLLFLTLSMTDWDFRQIVGKPDNVPIVAMLFIVGYFTWLYFNKSNENDDRIAAGKPPVEAENNEKVLVWPDLVYTELICMIALTAFLFFWESLFRRRSKSLPHLSKRRTPRRLRGTSSACRKCSSITTRGLRAWSSRV